MEYKKVGKLQRKTHSKLHYGLILLLVILCIGSVSALTTANFELDSNKATDLTNYGTITIKDRNWVDVFGLFDNTIEEITLMENTEQCDGNKCHAIMDIKMHERGKLVDGEKFYRIKDDGSLIESNIIDYQYYLRGKEIQTEIIDYDMECSLEKILVNGSKERSCIQVQSGSHIKTTYEWNEYNYEEVEEGNYILKLEGTIPMGKSYDWVIISQGKEIDEWASWTGGSLYDSLISYYDFDHGTGNLIDVYNGTYNMTNVGTTTYVKGKLINGSFIEDTKYFTGAGGAINNIAQKDGTINWWFNNTRVYTTSGGLSRATFFSNTNYYLGLSGMEIDIENSGGANHFHLGLDNGVHTQYINCDEAQSDTWGGESWNMLTLVKSGLNVTWYFNGAFCSSAIMNYNYSWGTSQMGKQVQGAGYYYFDGVLDELGVWNRAISSDEVSILYNNNTAVSFPLEYGEYGLITLNSPADASTSLSSSITFNASAITVGATLVNMTLWLDGISNETKSITGTSNESTWTKSLTTGSHDWTVQACDSEGDCGFGTNRTFTSGLLFINQSYVENTSEGSINNFEINFETEGQITQAYLNYNNTSYTSTITSVGDVYTGSINQKAALLTTKTNIPFFWNITFASGFNYISSTLHQSVSPIVINSTCSGGMNVIYNFTSIDELTQAKINGITGNVSMNIELKTYSPDRSLLIDTFSANFNGTNSVSICIASNLSNNEEYAMDLQLQYRATSYSNEFYNVWNGSLNSNTLHNNISLYDLPTASTKNFKILVRDDSYIPLENAIIVIERKYIQNGSFYTTEIPLTNDKGITTASLELNDVIYNFFAYKDGVLITSSTNVFAICQTPAISTCTIEINAVQTSIDGTDFTAEDDFEFDIGYLSASRTIFSPFTIPSGIPSLILLSVISEDALGRAACSDSITAATGNLTCVIPNSFGNSTVRVKVYKDGFLMGFGTEKLTQSSSDIYGVTLIFLSLIMMVTLIGIGISDNPVVTASFIFIGVVLIYGINLVQNNGFFGAGATILFLAIAIGLVILKAGRRS